MKKPSGGSYDFVVVGGGSAGSALANRLSAEAGNKVLVLEAGRMDWKWDVFIHMPAALAFPIGSRFYDWKYESEPEPHMNGRKVYHARGKVVGGSSSINGMIFQRGNPMDYERWKNEHEGLAGWDYAHNLPYFKRMESCLAGTDEYRGGDGPLVLERGPAASPLFDAFFEAVRQAGYPITDDVNGFRQEGFAAFDANRFRGRRMSAARSYLHPVLSRPNLHLKTMALTTKIRFDGTRAVGVDFDQPGRKGQHVHANHVVVCGGAINSPQLLQLSGVGPATLLAQHGIDVVSDLPGVGENMQDHLEVYVQYACKQPVSMSPHLAMWRRPFIGLQWLARRGPAATSHFEAGGFVRSNDSVEWPNLMFHFLPIAIRYDGSVPAAGHGYQIHIGPMFSNSRGSVRIKSSNPRDKPELRFNYLSTPQDKSEWVEAIDHARNILTQPAFEKYNDGELSPGPGVQTPDEILDWVRRDGETALHPSCTARMGVDELAVVHPDTMAVHGTEQLSVVDASVMPSVTNGNIYAPVMMIAEKAADMILGNELLAPEEVPWHKHDAATGQGSGEVVGALKGQTSPLGTLD